MDDMDSTQALLESTVGGIPELIDSVAQDDDEDEIFFGRKSSKERNSGFSRCSR